MRPDLKGAVAAALRRVRDGADDVQLVLASGLLDPMWVEEQTGRSFATPEEAAAAYLADPGCSPHPLFVPEWIEPRLGRPDAGQDPLVWYLREEKVRRRAATHPMIDLATVRELDPTYEDAPLGPVVAWLAGAGPDTHLPAAPGHPTTTLSALLDASRDALRKARARRRVREASHPVPLDAPVPTTGTPRLSIVTVLDDDATVLRRTVESVQAQAMRDWELLLVDAGSTDDSASVASGLLSFDERIRLVPFAGRGAAAARNAAMAQARAPYVGLLQPGETWPPEVVRTPADVDWADVATRHRYGGLTSVVLPARASLRATLRWVNTMASWPDTELVVTGAGLPAWQEVPLTVVTRAAGNARLVPLPPTRAGRALDAGAARTAGEVVVLVLGEVEPDQAAVSALVAGLADPEVAMSQAVDVDRRGVVVSAGAVFGASTARPEPFLAGHSVDDVRPLGRRAVPAAWGSLVAIRAGVLSDLEGFDPFVGDRLVATELSLRAWEAGLGRTELLADTVVVTQSPVLPEAAELATSLDAIDARRQSPPSGSDEAWAAAGFEVVGRRLEIVGDPEPDPLDSPMLRPRTVLRPSVESVQEAPASLRWTLDLAAPAGPKGAAWGDTHFGQALARALRRLGQHVCVDPREARHRQTRSYDDVVLVLRGLDRVAPRPECLNVMWVISHPDLVTAPDLAGFDLVYAAGTAWAEERSAEWGVPVRPLLQATDPGLFHPGRAEPDSGVEVLFVGNSRGVQRPALSAALAAGVPVVVHGRGWADLLPAGTVSSKGIDNAELGAAYAAACVVLNDHWDDMRRGGFVSNRLMDAAATGTRVVSDTVAGVDLTEMFHDLVQTFEDESELPGILAARDELFPAAGARAVAARRVAEEHSFDARAEVLLRDVLALRDR